MSAALHGQPDGRVTLVDGAATVQDFLDKEITAEVVLLDLKLDDDTDPMENTQRLIGAGYKVLVYSIADNIRLLRRALAGGAAGICRKADPIAKTIDCIEAVAAGQVVVSQEILAAIEGDAAYVAVDLGPREREVLGLYAGGFEVPEISARLGITENSVKEYLKRIRAKYTNINRPAASKLELFRRAIEDGIVPPVERRI